MDLGGGVTPRPTARRVQWQSVRFRAAVVVLLVVVGFAALGASLAAVETTSAPSPGTIQGQVLAESPVAGWHAMSGVRLEVRSYGVVVTSSRVSRSGRFELSLSPGTYVLSIPGKECWINVKRRRNSVVVRSDRRSVVTLRCPVVSAVG